MSVPPTPPVEPIPPVELVETPPQLRLGSTVSVPRIQTERLVLRPAKESDRAGIIGLHTDPQVKAYVGGPAERRDVERRVDDRGLGLVAAPPGSYVIADRVTDAFLGMTHLDRRDPECRGHVVDGGGELELSYLLLREVWGHGYATEACHAVLAAAAEELSDQPVVLVTQSANAASLRLADRLGFERVDTFEEFGAEQTLAIARLATFRTTETVHSELPACQGRAHEDQRT